MQREAGLRGGGSGGRSTTILGAVGGAVGLMLAVIGATPVGAIVIRHDVADGRYRVADSYLPALVDLPVEGHGVLIADQWVITAAHALTWRHEKLTSVVINGRSRAVADVILHPGARDPDAFLLRGDAAPLMAFQLQRADIALIRLAEPVRDVRPVRLYRGQGERGEIVEIIGRGASGDGVAGQPGDAPHRGPLRRAQNRIASADGAWLTYVFDQGLGALPLEGMLGNGDSGGPVLIRQGREWRLAGLASWQWWDGDLADFQGGVYGRTSYHVRISHFADWIDTTMRQRQGE